MYLKGNTTYHIQELTAPGGYTILPADINITTNATGSGVTLSGEGSMEVASVSTTTNENDTVTIINTKFHLPDFIYQKQAVAAL